MPPQHAFYVTQIPDLDKKKEGMKQAISEVVLFTYRYYKAWFFRNFITVKKIVLIIAIQHFSLLDANYYEMYVILTFFLEVKFNGPFKKKLTESQRPVNRCCLRETRFGASFLDLEN